MLLCRGCGPPLALLLLVLELLVEGADAVDAVLGLLFLVKFKTHGHFLILLPLEGKLVVALRLLVKVPEEVGALEQLFVIL